MDINRLNNSSNNQFNKTTETSKGKQSSGVTPSNNSADTPAHKVSISDYKFRKSDQVFAKLELSKLEASSSKQLADMKSKITAYQEAKEASPEKAGDTEIGKKINDPEVWESIAEEMLR